MLCRRCIVKTLHRTLSSCATLTSTRHASHTPLSTVHRGVQFEERSLILLQNEFSMSLRRVGGKSDGGIDLVGWWWLPPIPGLARPEGATDRKHSRTTDEEEDRCRIRVVAQCKAEKKKIGPSYVREMEGVLNRYRFQHQMQEYEQDKDKDAKHHPETYQGRNPSVGLLISQSAFTKEAILRAMSAPAPLLLLSLPPLCLPASTLDIGSTSNENSASIPTMSSTSCAGNGIGSAIWNPALGGARGLLGGEIEMRWEWSVKATGSADAVGDMTDSEGRPGLWWKGKKLGSWIPDEAI